MFPNLPLLFLALGVAILGHFILGPLYSFLLGFVAAKLGDYGDGHVPAGWIVTCTMAALLIGTLVGLTHPQKLRLAETMQNYMTPMLTPVLISEFIDAPRTSVKRLFVTYIAGHGLVVILVLQSLVRPINVLSVISQMACDIRNNPKAQPKLAAVVFGSVSLLVAIDQLTVDSNSRGMPDVALIYLFLFPMISFLFAMLAASLLRSDSAGSAL
ncbi:hypothetical protein KBY29_18335 [Ruegeria pomeroyi]|nr:hypothetical protein [Ruegeria pomeroyi]